MLKYFISSVIFVSTISAMAQRPQPDQIITSQGPIVIQPIHHGTLSLQWNKHTLYIDPCGGGAAFKGIAPPNLILITDVHGDHLSVETLEELNVHKIPLIVPQAVADKLPKSFQNVVTIDNGDTIEVSHIRIVAIPMYNLPETSDSRHPKGRGNGYILTLGEKNIYISGDTEDIPEMRSLEHIAVAFVCMNLPYTMNIQQAASAVLEFKPDIVYPFHYRGSDTEAFKKLIDESNSSIEVRLRNWYAE